jgi:hypothetical protein
MHLQKERTKVENESEKVENCDEIFVDKGKSACRLEMPVETD